MEETTASLLFLLFGVPLGAPGGRGWRRKGERCIGAGGFSTLGHYTGLFTIAGNGVITRLGKRLSYNNL